MVHFRKATWNDREPLLDLIEEGFAVQDGKEEKNEGIEHRILFSYLYNQPAWNPEWLYVAEEDGQLLAAAGYFPQALSFEEIVIPVGAISPVVTAPKYRALGLARKCLDKLMESLKAQGVPLVFLWGLPHYYTKLGFVPILPRYKTKISSKELAEAAYEPAGKFRECGFQDLKSISELYGYNHQKYWLQPIRSLRWWQERFTEMNTELGFIKEIPFPKKENFLVWENNSGDLLGYLNYSAEYFNYIRQSGDQRVVISEAVAIDPMVATAMLKSFAVFIKPHQILYIRGTPEHPLNAAAYQLGGTHLDPAPLAGMVKVIDWLPFLKLLTPLFQKRLVTINPAREEIHCGWRVDNSFIEFVMKGDSLKTSVTESQAAGAVNDGRLLVRLIFGVYQPADMEMLDPARVEYLRVLFPRKYPFIWDANYLY
jgi:predicted N-acetyltransferase YhbS